MKKINLVFGSSGFIAHSFLNCKENASKKFLCIDKKNKFLINPNHRFIKLNICNYKKLEYVFKKIISKYKIGEIWHLAANSDIKKGSQNPKIDFEDTFKTTFNIIEALNNSKTKVEKFIFASSSAIYGYKKNIKIKENLGDLKPISYYGAMKAASENLLSSYSFLNNTKCFIFRFPNVVGPYLTHGLIYDLIKKLKKNNNKLYVLGDGYQKKQYIHVDDLLLSMHLVTRKVESKEKLNIFNIAGEDNGIYVREIVKKFLNINNLKPKVIYQNKSYGWPGDIPKFRYNINKVKKIGWRPKWNSKDSIEKCIYENRIVK